MKDIVFKVVMLKGGDPTAEQIQSSVDIWLDGHPEATTTVQDGSLTTGKYQDESITEAKLSNELKLKAINNYITPEMFGAVGDGVTDDTDAVQRAIDTLLPVFGKNLYYVSEIDVKGFLWADLTAHVVTMKNNSTLISKITNNTEETKSLNPVVVVDGNNVKIQDSLFTGLKKGYAIIIGDNSSNVMIDNCVFEPCFKNDIICKGENVTIQNCVFDEHTSNSVIPISEYGNAIKISGVLPNYEDNGNNIKILGNTIYNHGDNGIDIFSGGTNIIISNNYIINYATFAIEDKLSDSMSVDVDNYKHIFSDNILIAPTGYRFAGRDYGSGYKPTQIIIKGGIIDAEDSRLTGTSACIYAQNVQDLIIDNLICKTTGKTFLNAKGNKIYITNSIINCFTVVETTSGQDAGFCEFDSCRITVGYRFSSQHNMELKINACHIDASEITGALFPPNSTAKILSVLGSTIICNNNTFVRAAIPMVINNNHIITNQGHVIYSQSLSEIAGLIACNNVVRGATKILRSASSSETDFIDNNVFISE